VNSAVGVLLLLGGCTSSPVTPFDVGDASVDGRADAREAAAPPEDGSSASDSSADSAFSFFDVPFVCGTSICTPGTQYCLHTLPEGGLTPEGGSATAECVSIPAACSANPTCACVETAAPCAGGGEGQGCVEAAGVDVSCP